MDLPTEVLTIILQQLHFDDLLLIACSCTRLNDIALRLFFHSVDFHPEAPEASLNIGVHPNQPFTILKGIRLSVTLRALHTLRCYFSSHSLIEEMKEVLELLILLPTVSSVHLTFPSYPHSQSLHPYYSMSYLLGSFPLWRSENDPKWLSFAKILLALLNALGGKSCTRLEIIGLTPPASLKSWRRRGALQAAYTLTEVIISTGGTLSGTLLDWVIQSINASPIRKLNLTTYYHWDLTALTVLSRAKLPHLTDFHMCLSNQVRDLVSCLRQNPNITSMRVVGWYPYAGVKLDMCPLPHLTHLAATPKFLIDFFSFPDHFPALHTVHLLTAGLSSSTPEEPQYTFSSVELTQAFSALRSCPTVRCMSLTMDHGIHVAPWMMEFRSPVDAEPQRMKSPFALHHILHLTVYAGSMFQDSMFQDVFAPWLGIMFPNLKTLVFDDLQGLGYAGKARYLRWLNERCPTLEEVSF
jgi:F-box domain